MATLGVATAFVAGRRTRVWTAYVVESCPAPAIPSESVSMALWTSANLNFESSTIVLDVVGIKVVSVKGLTGAGIERPLPKALITSGVAL